MITQRRTDVNSRDENAAVDQECGKLMGTGLQRTASWNVLNQFPQHSVCLRVQSHLCKDSVRPLDMIVRVPARNASDKTAIRV